jgi:putative transposase
VFATNHRRPVFTDQMLASCQHLIRQVCAAVGAQLHVRKYLWGKHFWSPSYLATSCGGAPLSIIK